LFVRTYAVTHPPGLDLPKRALTWHELAFAAQGVMTVITQAGAFVVPPHRAVFVPAGIERAVKMSGRVSLRSLYFSLRLSAELPRACRTLNVPPLLRELILHTTRLGRLRRDVPAEARLARVIADQLATLEQAPLQLPAPRDPRAERARALLEADATADLPLDEIARRAGASQRTLERLFRAETGLTFGAWRQRCRFVRAIRRLAAGEPVTKVALEVGYDSPSAFVSAFRRQMGTTPGRYFGE
jgi:AraC-like DNA-binding protein